MAIRVSNRQKFLWLIIIGSINYWLILFDNTPIVRERILKLSNSSIFRERILKLSNSSIYNEFLQLQVPFLRLVI